MLRSKVRWHEEGERSTKYLVNLVKKNFEKKHISKLERQDGNLTSDPKEILKEGATYYRNLYTTNKSINLNNKKFEKFFKIGQEMKLSDTDKDSLEDQLATSECKKALQQLAVGKTPGIEGLTSDFYRAFWEQLGHLVLNSMNEAYSKGEFMLAQNRGVIRLLPKPNKKEKIY